MMSAARGVNNPEVIVEVGGEVVVLTSDPEVMGEVVSLRGSRKRARREGKDESEAKSPEVIEISSDEEDLISTVTVTDASTVTTIPTLITLPSVMYSANIHRVFIVYFDENLVFLNRPLRIHNGAYCY